MNHRTSFAKRFAGACVMSGLALLSAGCPQNGGGNLGGTVIDVSLDEFTVTPEAATAAAGVITFRVRNDGTTLHEFMVVRTDLAPGALPTQDNGAYQEDAAGTEVIDEIEEFNPGQTRTLTLTLEAGSYVLLCNMVNQGVAHYAEGMQTAFTVTAGQ